MLEGWIWKRKKNGERKISWRTQWFRKRSLGLTSFPNLCSQTGYQLPPHTWMSYRYFQSHVPRTSLISSQICSSLSLPHLSEYTTIYPVFPTRNLGFTDQMSSPLPLTFLPCSFLVSHLRFLYLCLKLLMFSKVLSWFLFFQCHTLFLGGLSCIHGFGYHLHAHRPQSVLQAQASFPNSSPIQQVLHVRPPATSSTCHRWNVSFLCFPPCKSCSFSTDFYLSDWHTRNLIAPARNLRIFLNFSLFHFTYPGSHHAL